MTDILQRMFKHKQNRPKRVLQPGETYLLCPYDKAHITTSSKCLTHFADCREKYLATLNDEFESKIHICPFDSTHHVQDQNYDVHLLKCPKGKNDAKHFVENKMMQAGSISNPKSQHKLNKTDAKKTPFAGVRRGAANTGSFGWPEKPTRVSPGMFPIPRVRLCQIASKAKPIYNAPPEPTYVQCPYNLDHITKNSKCLEHFTNCRKTYLATLECESDSKVHICPFDAAHHVQDQDYDDHLLKCPKRTDDGSFVEKKMAQEGTDESKNPAATSLRRGSLSLSEKYTIVSIRVGRNELETSSESIDKSTTGHLKSMPGRAAASGSRD